MGKKRKRGRQTDSKVPSYLLPEPKGGGDPPVPLLPDPGPLRHGVFGGDKFAYRKVTPKRPRGGAAASGRRNNKALPLLPSSAGGTGECGGGNEGGGTAAPEATARPATTDDGSRGGKRKVGNIKVRYPYPTDYNDHFETPARAYDDIFPLLERALATKDAKRNGTGGDGNAGGAPGSDDHATIYDPYYCTGRSADLINDAFRRHGSASRVPPSRVRVRHEKRDFYDDVKRDAVPHHDVLVTNPPYSGNHKERCLEFAVDQLRERGRPFFLLMPNYVATKDYFRRIVLGDDDGGGDGGADCEVHPFDGSRGGGGGSKLTTSRRRRSTRTSTTTPTEPGTPFRPSRRFGSAG